MPLPPTTHARWLYYPPTATIQWQHQRWSARARKRTSRVLIMSGGVDWQEAWQESWYNLKDYSLSKELQLTPNFTGQKRRRPSRPSQNPLPNKQSPICQVHGLLVRRGNSHERNLQRRGSPRFISRPFSYTAQILPLRSHQIPSLRTGPKRHHQSSRTRDAHTKTAQRQHSRRDIRLPNLSPGGDSRPLSIRDEKRFAIIPLFHLSKNLQ